MLPHLGSLLLTGHSIISHTMVTTERAPWVITQIRDYNHPYATSKAELDSKMAKMAESPCDFYRGTAHIFYQDMKTWPSSQWSTPKTGFTWLNGDAHLGNFDATRNSKGNVVFEIADFDEGHLGQYIWDLRRLAVSMVLVGRDNGLNDADIEKAIEIMVQAYLKKCQNSVKVTRKNISYSTLTIPAVSSRKRSKLPTPNRASNYSPNTPHSTVTNASCWTCLTLSA
ncbi:hypothetical protein XFEB_01044 [Xylella fastidiosa EB92.1]|nr:hypothetical protein XFEB_01044 [Xylella fastidiosa EB92.1]